MTIQGALSGLGSAGLLQGLGSFLNLRKKMYVLPERSYLKLTENSLISA